MNSRYLLQVLVRLSSYASKEYEKSRFKYHESTLSVLSDTTSCGAYSGGLGGQGGVSLLWRYLPLEASSTNLKKKKNA